ncbi:MAG TPA: lantibiotic dehydratase [Nonomuraea sp.]|nr:lantibiotic dehydratase [Nonomuraea sp.]
MGEHEWTLLPTVVARSSGFPWELVRSLACPRAAETAAAVVRLEQEALTLLTAAPARCSAGDPEPAARGRLAEAADEPAGRRGSAGVPGRGGRLSQGLRGRLRRLRPLPPDTPAPEGWLADWNRVTGLLQEARLALSEVLAADLAAVRAAAARIAADERFLDALACSAPAAYRDLRRGPAEPSGLARHVQRLATRCAATGCHAPIGHARLDPGRDSGYTWAGHHELTRRVAYPTARVTEALQQRILADPALVAGLVPRRRAWTGATPHGAAFAGQCDGSRTLAEIAADTGTGMERASAALAVAVRRGLVTHDLCPPATVLDPLGWLRDRLPATSVHEGGLVNARGVPPQRRRSLARPRLAAESDLPAGRRVHEIAALLERYPAASPEVKLAVQSRIETLAGTGSGSSTVVDEAAASSLHVTIGGPLAADLRERVPRALDPLAEEAELTRLRTNRLLAARLGPGTYELAEVLRTAGDLEVQHSDRLAGLIRSAPPDTAALDLAEVFGDTPHVGPGTPPERAAGPLGDAGARASDLLRLLSDADARALHLAGLSGDARALDLAGLLGASVLPIPPVLCAVDVMVAAGALEAYEAGVTPLVLAALHDAPLLTPWELQFHPNGGTLAAERDAAVARALGGFTALNVISPRAGCLPSPEFPGPVLETGGAAADPLRRRVGLDDLYVRCDGHHVVLHAKGADEPLMFHNGGSGSALHTAPRTALHTALALPRIAPPGLPDLPRTPRLTWGNVVISRRRWQLGRAALEALGRTGGDRDLLLAMARLRAAHDLPPTFFAAGPGRRPLYVDTRAPALITELARLAGTADRVTLTETLPGPDECWLRDGGRRFAAQLRCVYLRPGRAPGTGEIG